MPESVSKSKGTVTYLSDVLLAFTIMFSTVFLLFIAALMVFINHVNITANVYGDVYYDTPLAGEALSVMLDSKYENFFVKDLLADAVWFGATDVKVSETKIIDLKRMVVDVADQFFLQEYSASITFGDDNIILLAGSGVKRGDKLKCAEHQIRAGDKKGEFVLCASRIG